MKSEVKADVLKFFLLLLSFVLLALGLGVACCGVWICFDNTSLIGVVSSHELRAVGAGLMLIGTLVMASSLVACLGARWEMPILMLICMWGLLFLFLCCVGLLLLLLLSRAQIEEKADAAVAHMIRQYRGDGRQDGLLDDLQQHEACCGLMGPSDWLQNSFVQTLNTSATSTLPCSCFGSPQRNLETAWCSQDPNVTHVHAIALANCTHMQGCRELLTDWLHENVVTVVGMDISLMVAQVLQLALALQLWRTFRRRDTLRTTHQTDDADSLHIGHAQDNSNDADSTHQIIH